ncbi:hypothetical protein [Anabaena sp. UHCC 0399]|uniref:hypothetical protein n=1 Tax=Anabaena sp. UHCC 0399 TaxID=3110238 RepID=UPI002B1F8187|nr:hypothetical protein [Anabaena sp. UHCC 0399]MEA5563942.1 hypothetical protein [Anabaena sp. UHCC 0399]
MTQTHFSAMAIAPSMAAKKIDSFSLSKITSKLSNYLSKIEAAAISCHNETDSPN